MKKITLISIVIFLIGLSFRLLAQTPLHAAHPPISVPALTPSRAEVASEGAGATAKSPLTPIARVNGVVLTQAQLDEEIQRLFPYYAIHGGRIPPAAEAELRERAVRDMVLHELVYQEARRRNLRVPTARWQQRVKKIQEGFSSRKAYEEEASKRYGSVAAFERRLRRAMLVEQLWNAEVTRKSAVTTQRARADYLRHKAQYIRPEAVWLQTITIKLPNNSPAQEQQQARKIAEQILVKAKAAKTYEEFGILAEQLSQDDWRVMMGDHRWVHRGTVTADIEAAVFSLKAGETSGIVESAGGFMILRANGHQPKRQMSFAEMGTSIRERLEKAKREELSRKFEQLLRSKAKVEML